MIVTISRGPLTNKGHGVKSVTILGNEHPKALQGVIVEVLSIRLRRGRLGQINISSHVKLASRLRQLNSITGGNEAPNPLLDFGWQPVELRNICVLQNILIDLLFCWWVAKTRSTPAKPVIPLNKLPLITNPPFISIFLDACWITICGKKRTTTMDETG
jgi:hypothetical protein